MAATAWMLGAVEREEKSRQRESEKERVYERNDAAGMSRFAWLQGRVIICLVSYLAVE